MRSGLQSPLALYDLPPTLEASLLLIHRDGLRDSLSSAWFRFKSYLVKDLKLLHKQ